MRGCIFGREEGGEGVDNFEVARGKEKKRILTSQFEEGGGGERHTKKEVGEKGQNWWNPHSFFKTLGISIAWAKSNHSSWERKRGGEKKLWPRQI